MRRRTIGTEALRTIGSAGIAMTVVFLFVRWIVGPVWVPLAIVLSIAMSFGVRWIGYQIASAGHAEDEMAAVRLAEIRQQQAQGIVSALKRGEPVGQLWTLYLRPFVSDGTMSLRNPLRKRNGLEEPDEIDFQELLERAEWPGEFVAIGDANFVPRGAAKVLAADAEWRHVFELLAKGAVLVLVVPHFSEGCIYEMRMLLEWNLLSKTIFVMPPTLNGSTSTFDSVTEWAKAKRSFGSMGLAIPDYLPGGCLFQFNDDRTLASQRPLFRPVFSRATLLTRIFLGRGAREVDKVLDL